MNYVDVYHLHGVVLEDYDYMITEIVPTLQKMRDQGKILFLGITEQYEPGTHVILSGTGSPEHFMANLATFARPPLPPEDVRRLKKIFGRVISVTGQ